MVRPILIVGANVGGRPNFMEVGGGGLVSTDPPMVALPLRHERYTLRGIRENLTFSVNVPSVALAKETDYCGMASGATTDKIKACGFTVFYGKLATAPMIEQFPVNMECSVVHTLGSPSHAIVIGRVDGTFVSEEYLRDGQPDFEAMNQLLWFANKSEYVAVGPVIGKSRSIGRGLGT